MKRVDQRRDSEADAGRSRRHYLGGVAATATAALAGCSGILDGGGGDGDPETTVDDFYTALGNGNANRVNELLHPDASAGELSEDQVQQFSELEFSVDDTELVEEDGDRAVVDVTITTTIQDQEQTNSQEIELRRHEGNWRVYGAPSS